MTKEGCMNHLRTFYPEARDEDWQVTQLVNVYKLLKILKRMVKDLSNLVLKWLILKTTQLLHY